MREKLITAGISTLGFLSNPLQVLAQSDYEYDPSIAYTTSTLTDEQAAGVLAAMGVGVWVIVCISLIVAIAMIVWVYKDAKKRNNPNAVLWAVLTFFFGLLGLVIYLLAGRKVESTPEAK